MKNLIVFAIAGMLFYGCSNSTPKTEASAAQAQQNNIEITNDLENASAIIPSWVNESSVIRMKEPVAHSGEFACITNDSIQYSYAFNELTKNINSGLPKTVVVSAWVYTTVESPDLSVIFSTSKDQKQLDWKVFPLKDILKEKGKWVEITATFYPDKIDAEQNINIYAWNTSKKPIYIDDFKINFLY